MVYKIEAEDTRKLQKVSLCEAVAAESFRPGADCCTAEFRLHRSPGRMGILDRTHNIYSTGFLHTDVADRIVTHRHLGRSSVSPLRHIPAQFIHMPQTNIPFSIALANSVLTT
jgi:hypothetical protein